MTPLALYIQRLEHWNSYLGMYVESISELLRYAVPGWWRRGWVGHTPWTKLPLWSFFYHYIQIFDGFLLILFLVFNYECLVWYLGIKQFRNWSFVFISWSYSDVIVHWCFCGLILYGYRPRSVQLWGRSWLFFIFSSWNRCAYMRPPLISEEHSEVPPGLLDVGALSCSNLRWHRYLDRQSTFKLAHIFHTKALVSCFNFDASIWTFEAQVLVYSNVPGLSIANSHLSLSANTRQSSIKHLLQAYIFYSLISSQFIQSFSKWFPAWSIHHYLLQVFERLKKSTGRWIIRIRWNCWCNAITPWFWIN